MSHLRSLGVAVVLAALPAASRAYERSIHEETGACLYWPARALTYHINPDRGGTAPSCGGPPASSAAIQAVVSGFAEWTEAGEWTEATPACTDLALTRGDDTAAISVGYSSGGGNENLVVFRHGWCDGNAAAMADPCWTDREVRCSSKFNCFGEGGQSHSTIALTTTTYRPSTGEIVDADMELVDWTGAGLDQGIANVPQGYYFTCAAPSGLPPCTNYGEADCFSQDLENTVTHEVGHFIGFAHDFDNQDSTMWWQASRGEIGKRDLEASDVDGLCAVYASGKAALSCVKKRDDSGCATGGGAGILGLLGLLSLRRPRRAQRTTTAA